MARGDGGTWRAESVDVERGSDCARRIIGRGAVEPGEPLGRGLGEAGDGDWAPLPARARRGEFRPLPELARPAADRAAGDDGWLELLSASRPVLSGGGRPAIILRCVGLLRGDARGDGAPETVFDRSRLPGPPLRGDAAAEEGGDRGDAGEFADDDDPALWAATAAAASAEMWAEARLLRTSLTKSFE